jgi:hypothetical protein
MDGEQTQIEEIIREVAVKHGVAVSRDDPILILQTINHRLLLEGAKAQQALLDKYKEEHEALAAQWRNDAREKAERILNASLTASRDAIDQVMQEVGARTAKTIAAQVDAALARVDRSVHHAERTALLNVIAACLTMAAAAIALWAVAH